MRSNLYSPHLLALAFVSLLSLATPLIAQQSSNPAPTATPSPSPSHASSATTIEENLPPEQSTAPPPQTTPYYRRTLTLAQAVELALKQASPYTQAQVEQRIAREDLRQSRIAFLPQLTMPLTSSMFSSARVNDETLWLVNATGEIDLSGRLRHIVRRNRYLLDAAEANALATRRVVALAAVDAYYGLMLAREKEHLAQETLSLAVAFEQLAKNRLASGEGEESDALRAQTQVARRRDELEQARAGETSASNALSSLTGIDFADTIRVSEITQNLPIASDFDSYTAAMLDARPELRQINAARQAALAEARAARAERYPQLFYSMSAGYDATELPHVTRYADAAVALGVSIPVFDFGARRSRETQARLRAESLDMQRDYTVRVLRQEFYTARAVALAAITRIKMTEAGMAAAQKNFTLVFANYRQNKAAITDVIDAQDALAEANLAYYQAIIDYRIARIRLETTIGQ